MKKSIMALAAAAAILVGCSQPVTTPGAVNHPAAVATTVTDYQVTKLFDVDGCTVYKFNDNLDDHYFSRCAIASVTAVTTASECGPKGCSNTTIDSTTNLPPAPAPKPTPVPGKHVAHQRTLPVGRILP